MVSEGVEKVCMCVVRYGLQRRVWGSCYRYTQVHVGCLFAVSWDDQCGQIMQELAL